MVCLVSYKHKSAGGKNLLAHLPNGTRYLVRPNIVGLSPDHLYVNWGHLVNFMDLPRVLNKNACLVSGKREFYSWLSGAGLSSLHPRTTENANVAQIWVGDGPVIAKTLNNGHGGTGIFILNYQEQFDSTLFPLGTLFSKYIPKESEYRYHFFKEGPNRVFPGIWQKKKLLLDTVKTDYTYKVRNKKNGWVFSSHDIAIPDPVLFAAAQVIDNIPLNFGALDIIYNRSLNKAYVIEVNTAPGLSITTNILRYANFITEMSNRDALPAL